jgi:hypothetical protein
MDKVGTYRLKVEKIFTDQSFPTASWWRKVKVKPGDYDILADRYMRMIMLPGVCVDAFFPSSFGGVMYGNPDRYDIGKDSIYRIHTYDFCLDDLNSEDVEIIRG